MKKNAVSILILLFILGTSFAQNAAQQRVRAKLTQASVYLQGASLTHTASVVLKNGAQEVQFDGLCPSIETGSLKVTCSNGSVILSSVEFSTDYLSVKSETAHLQKLRDSLKICQKQLQDVLNAIQVDNKLLKTLSDGIANNTQQKEKILSPAELSANMDLYKAKAPALQKSLDEEKELQSQLNQRITRLKNQIAQDESKERLHSGVVTAAVSAPLAGKADFTITYYTTKASWTPIYDIQIHKIGEPVILTAKAQVRQTTGLDWEQVRLNLSNARPNQSNTAPEFSTWFLRYKKEMRAPVLYKNAKVRTAIPTIQNCSIEEDCAENQSAQTAQASSIYLLDGNAISKQEYESIDPAYLADLKILEPEEAQRKYGTYATTYVATTKSMDDFVQLQGDEVETSYAIGLPYNIAGNGKAQLIELKKHEIKAEYYYYAAPKLVAETYLMANLSDWAKYNLLPGTATISYNGSFISKTQLNTSKASSFLTLTLASEPRITVKRSKRTDFSSSKTLGSNTTETRSHLITVKNNLGKSVRFVLKDQYPVSTDKDIEVKLTEHTPSADINQAETGTLSWDMTLAPNETRTFQVTYTVKYPKEQSVELE